jgi:16S rRNA (guanine527-N7)-methyltransferase
MKGRNPDQEIEEMQEQSNWRVDNIQALSVPELNAQRCLVSLIRQGNP